MSPVRVPKMGTVREYLWARMKSPAISLDTVSEVLGDASLGSPVSIRNLAHGWRTNLVEVVTTSSHLVVRRYPERWSDLAVEHEHSLLLELGALDFPAPRLIKLGDGSYLRRIDGARYSVQSYEEGRMLTGFYLGRFEIERVQHRIGQVLARFHDALTGFIPPGAHHLGIDPESGRQRRGLAWHLEVVDRLDPNAAQSEPFGSADDVMSLRRRLIELDELIDGANLPRAIVHGDYGLHNVIFRHSGEAVVHDFELSRRDIRLLDLVASLSRVRPEFRGAFLDGLRAGDGVSGTELDLLDVVWEWYRIRGAIQSTEAFMRLGGQHRLTTVSKRLAEARAIRSGQALVPGREVGAK